MKSLSNKNCNIDVTPPSPAHYYSLTHSLTHTHTAVLSCSTADLEDDTTRIINEKLNVWIGGDDEMMSDSIGRRRQKKWKRK